MSDVSGMEWSRPETEATWQALVDRIAGEERESVLALLADARAQLQAARDALGLADAATSPTAVPAQRQALERAIAAVPASAPSASPNRASEAAWRAWDGSAEDALSQAAAISDALRVAGISEQAATVDKAGEDLSLALQRARHYRAAPEVVLASAPPPTTRPAGGFPWWLILVGALALPRKRRR